MVPETSQADGDTSDHVTSHDSGATPPHERLDSESFPLTAALRMSIAGEGLAEKVGLEDPGSEDLRESQSQPATAGHFSSPQPVELIVPEDLAIDLRVKLAVCLIYLGMDVPEVSVCVCARVIL